MARPRQFEEPLALDRAMRLFWEQGFEGTSMEALVQATGVHRASLYASFGDKQALFLKALEYYADMEQAKLARALRASPSKLAVIRAILEGIAEDSARKNGKGCFMVNSLIERSPHDAGARKTASDCMMRLAALLESALKEAKQAGELGAGQDVRKLALFLVNTIQGMRVLGKAGTSRRELQASVEVALRALH